MGGVDAVRLGDIVGSSDGEEGEEREGEEEAGVHWLVWAATLVRGYVVASGVLALVCPLPPRTRIHHCSISKHSRDLLVFSSLPILVQSYGLGRALNSSEKCREATCTIGPIDNRGILPVYYI